MPWIVCSTSRVAAGRHLGERARVSASKARKHLSPLLRDLVCGVRRLGPLLVAEELQQLRAALGVLELRYGLRFDLADSLTGYAECPADLLEGLRRAPVEAEPTANDLLLALAQLAENSIDSVAE